MKKIVIILMLALIPWIEISAQNYSEEQLSALYKKGGDYLDQNNLREALKCFLVVAEQTGEKHTEYVVGSIYYDLASDDGDNYDTYREAVKWFRKSADQGNPTAQYCLGLCYYDGRGVDYNRTEAAKWYRKAADQGFADAMYDLGGMYYKGEGGCDRDIAEALKWYKKAKNAGNKDADAMIAYCEEKLNDKKTGKSEFGYEADDPFAILFGALVGAAIKGSDKEVGYKETAKNETKNVQQTNSAKSESSGRLDNVQNSPTHSKAVTSATQTPNPTTSLSSSSTNTDGHMLTFSKDVRAKATIYDLLYYPMGVVDLSAFKCTLNYIRDFVKSHYNHTLSEGTDRLIWRKTDEPVKYNIEIDGLQLHEAQFYNSGEDYWNWSYSISEKPENLSYEDAKKALLHWKEQLEAIDFTFKLKKDTEDMYVLISENLKTKVELSCYHTWNYTSPKISFVWREHIYTPVTK